MSKIKFDRQVKPKREKEYSISEKERETYRASNKMLNSATFGVSNPDFDFDEYDTDDEPEF